MIRTHYLPLLLTALIATLTGCGDKEADKINSASADTRSLSKSKSKSMTVDVSGALNLHYEAKGDAVGVIGQQSQC